MFKTLFSFLAAMLLLSSTDASAQATYAQCENCTITQMPARAISEGIGTRYVYSFSKNTLRRFSVRQGTGSGPNAIPNQPPPTDKAHGVSTMAGGQLVAVQEPVPANVSAWFNKHRAIHLRNPGFLKDAFVEVRVPIEALPGVTGPVQLASQCCHNSSFQTFQTAVRRFLNDPLSVRPHNSDLADLIDGYTDVQVQLTPFGLGFLFSREAVPQTFTLEFCDDNYDCAQWEFKPKDGSLEYKGSYSMAGDRYPQGSETHNYAFDSSLSGGEFARGLRAAGIPVANFDVLLTVVTYISCWRVGGGPWQCAVTGSDYEIH